MPKFRIGDTVAVDEDPMGSKYRSLYWGKIQEHMPEGNEYKVNVEAIASATQTSINNVETKADGKKLILVYWKTQIFIPPRYIIVHEDCLCAMTKPDKGDMSEMSI